MDDRLPYYMAYPMPLLYDDDRIARRDLDYMKSLYPAAAKRLIPYIEEECDRLEYEGSMMYDEYPDQLQLRLMCRRIYDQVAQEEENPALWCAAHCSSSCGAATTSWARCFTSAPPASTPCPCS